MLKKSLYVICITFGCGYYYSHAASDSDTSAFPIPLDWTSSSDSKADPSELFGIPLDQLLEESTVEFHIPPSELSQAENGDTAQEKKELFGCLIKRLEELHDKVGTIVYKQSSQSLDEAFIATDEFDVAPFNNELNKIKATNRALLKQAKKDIAAEQPTPIDPRNVVNLGRHIKHTQRLINQIQTDMP